MQMTPALAARIRERAQQNRIRPVYEEEEVEIIADWLGGASLDLLSRRHRRGLKRIREIIVKYQEAAKQVPKRPA